eukprot:TRINITY_DN38625_c0_g1_i1.p1 TRINITY_DN38625_c0_g1~~TRINITY_DN38625_c0_g1_i1.p1  ORF type:complete len:461 (+),score=59.79 TRINITY_DN38625_c0_g1_i1:39-1385(+)
MAKSGEAEDSEEPSESLLASSGVAREGIQGGRGSPSAFRRRGRVAVLLVLAGLVVLLAAYLLVSKTWRDQAAQAQPLDADHPLAVATAPVLQCSSYTLTEGTLAERCLAGNALRDGWEYYYNPMRLEAIKSLCGPCVCCKRRRSELLVEQNPFECTATKADGKDEREKCRGGNALKDGWLYVYDVYRYEEHGKIPVCNGCACCRRRLEASLAFSHQPFRNGLDQPVNIILNCPSDTKRRAQFTRNAKAAGLTFEVFPCFNPTEENVQAAIRKGLVSPTISWTVKRGTIGDDEALPGNYAAERARILGSLPTNIEYVKLNNLRTTGVQVPGVDPRVLRMTAEWPEWRGANVWLSNYVVSAAGARKLLTLLKGYDGSAQIDFYISGKLLEVSMGGLQAYSVRDMDMVSTHCQVTSVRKEVTNKFAGFDREPWAEITWQPDQAPACYSDVA